MEINSDNLEQISLIRLSEDLGIGEKRPQRAAASARSACVSWGTVGGCGIVRIGSRSTDGDGLGGCQDAKPLKGPYFSGARDIGDDSGYTPSVHPSATYTP